MTRAEAPGGSAEVAPAQDELPAASREILACGTAPAAFDARVGRSPEDLALVDRGRRLTFAELQRVADAYAEIARTGTRGAGSRVAVVLPRSAEAVAALIGITRAARVWVPLDRSLPRRRLDLVLEDAEIELVIAADDAAVEPPSRAAVVRPAEIAARGERRPPLPAPDDTAYTIYTSGSTGTPKGVEVDHRALIQHCAAWISWIGLTPGDRMFNFHSLSSDVSIEEIYPPLLAGAAVVTPSHDELPTGDVLARELAAEGVTITQMPTVYWRLLLRHGGFGPAWDACEALRTVIVGGEGMRRTDLEQWWDVPLSRRVDLVNAYGPTECIMTPTAHRYEQGETSPAIGRPLAFRCAYVVGRDGRPVTHGEGELLIGGTCLARGYLKRPVETRKRFVRLPGLAGGGRLYRTGDIVRWRPEGDLDFVSRIDGQVKIRGSRIELEDVEAAVASAAGVAEAACVVRGRRSDDPSLVAFVVAGLPGLTADAVRRHLEDVVPPHMIPARIDVVGGLPKLPSGKIDRVALERALENSASNE